MAPVSRVPRFFYLVMDEFCHFAIGEEHEFLDELVSVKTGFAIDAERLAVLVQFEFYLVLLELDGSRGEFLFLQYF